MQHLILLFVSALLATACQGSREAAGSGTTAVAPAAAAPAKAAGAGCLDVQGEVFFSQAYCGGARPTREMEAAAEQLHRLPNTLLLLRPANKQNVEPVRVQTDAQSRYQVCLAPGIYFVYLSADLPNPNPTRFDPACDQWLKTPLGQLEVSRAAADNRNVTLKLAIGCNPCEPPRP